MCIKKDRYLLFASAGFVLLGLLFYYIPDILVCISAYAFQMSSLRSVLTVKLGETLLCTHCAEKVAAAYDPDERIVFASLSKCENNRLKSAVFNKKLLHFVYVPYHSAAITVKVLFFPLDISFVL